MRINIFLTLLSILFSSTSFAGIVHGYITDDQGDPLPFATIYIKETGNGTVANADAYYELNLAPGNYELVFQFIGFKTEVRNVTITEERLKLNVKLSPEALVLREVQVMAGKEDPAYSIMRRAIAKAGFHLNQLDSFSAKVYIKGTGQVKDMPFFMRKKMEEEGLDTSRVFISESVNEITFKRPDTYSERVISIRSSGKDNNTNPNAYIFTSFYKPEIAEMVSPLSPKAFAYYRFSYEGTFEERGVEVSRIRVTPRSKGDNVFEGYIQIVEGLWSIHSLDLKGVKLGITFSVNQMYAPVQEKIWLPISHKVMFYGSILGFAFEYRYLASVSDYYLELNPELNYDLIVIDEKTDPEKAGEVAQNIKNEEVEKLEELIATKEVNRKQLRQLVKEYEKMEKQMEEEPEVVSRRNFKVDSTAYTMDSTYWDRIRPIPLSTKEVTGYQQVDSVASAEESMAKGDTLRASKGKIGFQATDLIFGDIYKIADKTYIDIENPLLRIHFNTVDGWNAEYALSFSKTFGENNNFIKITPLVRYAFTRKAWNGKVSAGYDFGSYESRNSLNITAGRYYRQLNEEAPIHPIMNTSMTLLWESNYMKLFEQDFVSLYYNKILGDMIAFSIKTEFAERRALENHSDFKLVNRDAVENYLPNNPENLELVETQFPTHNSATLFMGLQLEPWLKYRVRNGKKTKIQNSSPTFNLLYRGARPIGSFDTDFDQIEVGARHVLKNGIRGQLQVALNAGKFLRKETMFFPDYKHFKGNRTPFVGDPVTSFRLLDYYNYSTNGEYMTIHTQYQFRKFLATQFTFVRMMGLRESILVNYLVTPHSENYTEVGYSLDYILRVLRIEAIAAFRDGQYENFGIRIGLAFGLFSVSNN